jgi:hypothetical protein
MNALPPGTIPTAYAPLVQLVQTMVMDDGSDDDAPLERRVAQLLRRVRAQQRRLARARRTIRAYRAQNRLLARAHGACECWGGNPSCGHCGGRGAAGWMPSDTGLLRDLLGSHPGEAPSRGRARATSP